VTHSFKLSRRIARLRAPVFAAVILTIAACNTADSFNPDTSIPATASDPGSQSGGQVDTVNGPLASLSYAGGIPMGLFHLPDGSFGSRYNGALRTISPSYLLSDLAAIKSRGGKVILCLTGSQSYFKDSDGHFSFTKWKARVDRFRTVNFSSYINDGTVVAHYLIDEPYDPANFGGQPVTGSTLEAMAQYSKGIWPGMATIVRAEPYLIQWSGTYHYLDAAWGQYLYRKGDVSDYLAKNVSYAQKMGLALVVGLNIRDGGTNNTNMTATQVQSWGSTLLGSGYPCAFISWRYGDSYLNTTSMQSAMDVLRSKAENRSIRTCRSSDLTTDPTPTPTPTPTPSPSPTPVVDGALPFGVAFTPTSQWSTRLTGPVYRANPTDLVTQLERAQTAKMNIIVALASPWQSKNADGTFSLTKWKAQVDLFRTLSLNTYISSKALYLHYLVDQPNCASCWGGTAIPWSTVEEMAKYSKSIWPSLPTIARVPPSKLAGASFQWTYLDAGWAQYDTRRGNPSTWLAAEVTQARAEGLGVVAGLNLLDASGYQTSPMTASQIKAFGTILAESPSVCALAGWKYDSAYLGQSGIAAALDSVAKVAKSRTAASCVAG
jgi:hypothetical protein